MKNNIKIIADVIRLIMDEMNSDIQDSSIASNEDVLSMLMDLDIVAPIADKNNAIFTSIDGKIYIL